MVIGDLLYPKFCLGCGFIGAYVCSKCLKKVEPLKDTTCICCGKASANGLNHYWCLKRLNVDGMTSLFKYQGLLRKIIKNSKYRLAYRILEDFLKGLTATHLDNLLKFKKSFTGALIQPIPLSSRRLKERGFNQSLILGKYLSWVLGLKMADFMVRKCDNTPQAELESVKRRYENVKGIFGLRPGARIKGRIILIVDDVTTSGATIKEAASVLKRAGAFKVFVFALAKG